MPLVHCILRVSNDIYLFTQPFDITATVQTADTSTADMTVEVTVKPEIRGELDASKLARLLQVLPVISSTFSRANCLASVSLADKAVYPSPHYLPNRRSARSSMSPPLNLKRPTAKFESLESVFEGELGIGSSDETLEGLEGFLTPPQSPPRRTSYSLKKEGEGINGQGSEDALNFSLPDVLNAILAESQTSKVKEIEEDRTCSMPLEEEEEDPMHVSMKVNVRIPEVALDLTYDVSKGRQLVLAVRTLEVQVLFRPHDMQILFDLSELSIQDSLRSKAQQDIARTPRGEKSLIHISYACMYNPLSPLYRRHATEVVVEFATLGLNFDVNTVMHLRPFMEVLLARKAAPPPPPSPSPSEALKTLLSPLSSISTHGSNNDFLSVNSLPYIELALDPTAVSSSTSPVNVMKGMHIFITVSNISLDLLRTPTADTEGAALESAFSLQITDLRADIDIIDLVKADVKLHSFDIVDSRPGSTDYVFRKVFCPVVDMDASLANWRASAVNTSNSKTQQRTTNQEKDTVDSEFGVQKGAERPPDLLHIVYNQITGTISSVNVEVLNVTSFIAIDTILDLSYVAMANAFAVMDLIASPPPLPEVCMYI